MKLNQKLLSIQASLVVLAGLFGFATRANEEQGKLVLHYIIAKMPDSCEVWYRQQLKEYWDKDFIDGRRKEFTPETVRFANLVWHENGMCEGMIDHSIDTIALPCKWPLWLRKLLNIMDGKESHNLAHEYIHLAKHHSDFPIDNVYLDKIGRFFSQNLPIRYWRPELSGDNGQAVDSKTDTGLVATHNEFFCELKSLELTESKNPAAYEAFMRAEGKKYVRGFLDRDKKYPNPFEMLAMRALYKKEKEKRNNANDPEDTVLHGIIDKWLKNRDFYEKARVPSGFLEEFERERTKFSLDGEKAGMIAGFLFSGTNAAFIYVYLCGYKKVAFSSSLLTNAAVLYAFCTLKSILTPTVEFRLSNYDPFWDKDKFEQALDHDSARVAEMAKKWIDRSKKLDGMWVE